MGLRIHLRVSVEDATVLADHVADALRVASLRIVGRPVRHADLAVDVAQQAEREVELLGEGAVLVDAVEADPQDVETRSVEPVCVVAKRVTLDRSAGGVGACFSWLRRRSR